MENNTLGATMSTLNTSATAVHDPRLVQVAIQYPEDFSGSRYFKNGETRSLSAESAAALVSRGIASYVDQKESDESAEEPEDVIGVVPEADGAMQNTEVEAPAQPAAGAAPIPKAGKKTNSKQDKK